MFIGILTVCCLCCLYSLYTSVVHATSSHLISQENGNILVLEDMNFPKLSWDDDDVPIIKPGCSCPRLYEDFIEMLNDFNLSQVIIEAIRGDSILDIFLTTNSTLVNSVNISRPLRS